ncbi:MAG: FHA domain-containing protein, partial [Myxococcota bacterium]
MCTMSTPETESVTGTRVLSRGRDQVWVHRTLHLEVESGVRSGERIALVPGELRFGSGPDADFFLEDEAVSALHFALALGDDGVWLTDLNSTNGPAVKLSPRYPDTVHPGAIGAVQIGEPNAVV